MPPKAKAAAPAHAAKAPTATSAPAPAAVAAPAAASAASVKPPRSPIAIYDPDHLTARQASLLARMSNMRLYKPKQLPPPQLGRTRGWLSVLVEKYNIEMALYMVEPWERWLLNTILVLFCALFTYWAVMGYDYVSRLVASGATA
jgi:hypothetical protein